MSGTLIRHRFTVEQYEEMIDAGILTENDRVELLRGEVVEKTTIRPAHAACVKRLNRLFQQHLGNQAVISVQDPLRLVDSEPEPDLILLRPRDDFYVTETPGAELALLVIEVADTTLESDRTIKCELYAEAGIVEYWIVNLLEDCIEVHREPSAAGVYANIQKLYAGAVLAPLHFPGCQMRVAELLPRE